MDPSRATELKVGLFTLLGIALLVGGVMWGRQQSLIAGAQTYRIHFPNSEGLLEGDAVAVNGVRSGRVEAISVDTAGVLVRVSLDGTVALRRDATATIMMVELMGGKKIELRPGVDPAPLGPNDVLQGTSAQDIPGAIALLGNMTGDLTRVLFRLDTLLAAANTLLTDRELVAAVRDAVVTLDATAQKLRTFVDRNEGDMQATVTNVKALVTDMRTFFVENRDGFARLVKGGNAALDGVDRTIASADSTLAALNGLLRDARDGNGTIHRLVYDRDFGTRLDSTIANANRVLTFILDHGVNVNLRLGTRP